MDESVLLISTSMTIEKKDQQVACLYSRLLVYVKFFFKAIYNSINLKATDDTPKLTTEEKIALQTISKRYKIVYGVIIATTVVAVVTGIIAAVIVTQISKDNKIASIVQKKYEYIIYLNRTNGNTRFQVWQYNCMH